MTTPNSTRCLWPPEDLAQQDIPASAKEFLRSKGLPFFVGSSAFEFGIYDSDDAFVIGQDSDYAIYIAADGSIWHESSDNGQSDQFFNSSVQHLDRFLSAYISWSDSVHDLSSDECALWRLEQWLRCALMILPRLPMSVGFGPWYGTTS